MILKRILSNKVKHILTLLFCKFGQKAGDIDVKMECGDPCYDTKVIVSINDNAYYNSEYYADTTGTVFIKYEKSFTHDVNIPLWGFHKYAYTKGDVDMDSEKDISRHLNTTLKPSDITDQETPVYEVFFADSLALM